MCVSVWIYIYIYIYIYLGGIIIVNTTLIELVKKDMLVKVVTNSMNLDNIEWWRRIHIIEDPWHQRYRVIVLGLRLLCLVRGFTFSSSFFFFFFSSMCKCFAPSWCLLMNFLDWLVVFLLSFYDIKLNVQTFLMVGYSLFCGLTCSNNFLNVGYLGLHQICNQKVLCIHQSLLLRDFLMLPFS